MIETVIKKKEHNVRQNYENRDTNKEHEVTKTT